ncbi:cytochrome P450 4B1 [Bombina bombina]|uniref:cytochrome P450 4B1 n=1 Tax=Bombina bombina TaxID=8345 RepID=UPI00235A8EEF|nr:cytochrome P450 4B1 [Bombina bombina]
MALTEDNWLSLGLQQYLHLAGLLCLLSVLLKVAQLYSSRRHKLNVFRQFPGPSCHWLYGNVNEFRRDGNDLDILVKWTGIHSGAFPVWFGNFTPFLFLTHPDYAKTIFNRDDPKSSLTYDFIVPWIGRGLLVLSGPKWFQHRRLLTPGFHYDVLKPYVKLMSDSTTVMLDKWEKLIPEKKPVELFQHVSLMTLDSIMKCAFSYESQCQRDSDNAYIKAVFDLSYLTNLRLRCFPYHSDAVFYISPHGYRFRKACRITHQHTEKVIQQRKESMKHEKELEKILQKRHLDFLDILLFAKDENGQGLSDEDLRAEVDTFMFEGHDTTASGISWILFCMAKYPEHQKKCRDEIRSVLAERRHMEWDDLSKIPYTTMCIKESLRMYPPVPGVARSLRKPVTFFDGRSVPAGTLIALSIYSIHRNPDVWKDPEVFDPLRFSPENSSGRHSHAFLPFAAGPRNCIGQNFAMNEMKVAVALTLNRFHLAPDPKNPPIKIPQLVLKSKNGIYVQFTHAQ